MEAGDKARECGGDGGGRTKLRRGEGCGVWGVGRGSEVEGEEYREGHHGKKHLVIAEQHSKATQGGGTTSAYYFSPD